VHAPAHVARAPQGAAASWPSEWTAQAMQVEQVDPLFGTSALAIAPALQPVELDSALAVADGNTGSVGLFERSGGDLRRTAVLRPGGAVTALGAAEGLLLAATAQRRLVAYSPDGIRQWTAPLADVLVAPPIAGDAGAIIIGGADGSVTALDARSGEQHWSTSVSSDAVSHLLRAGDKAIAVDRTGHLVALSLADGSVLWRSEGATIDAITATDDAVLVARDNSIDRLDAETGAEEWSSPTGTWVDVIAFAADDGAPRWRAPGADRAVTDGRTIVLDGRNPTRVLDARGDAAADLRTPGEDLGAARFLVGARDGAWIVDSTHGTTWVGHE
jgi:outer membrane protein assembly factor BamB